jgi:hypothetical protein
MTHHGCSVWGKRISAGARPAAILESTGMTPYNRTGPSSPLPSLVALRVRDSNTVMATPPKARLCCIQMRASAERCETLVLSLLAILEACGGWTEYEDYDDLAAVTGVAFMATYAPDVPDPAWWPAFGRHAFLKPAARAYGLTLRELHPPEAAPLPQAPPEFAGHFRDSYAPFIREAICRDEPALAWMGWPPPNALDWGVICAFDEEEGLFRGITTGHTWPVPLAGPAVQVYVLQEYTPKQPIPELCLRAALGRAALIYNNRLDPSFGVVTGPEAIVRWREALVTSMGAQPAAGMHQLARVHSSLATRLTANLQTASRFFSRNRHQATVQQGKVIDAGLPLFEHLALLLKPTLDADSLEERLGKERGRAELLDALDRLIQGQREAADLFSIQENPTDL